MSTQSFTAEEVATKLQRLTTEPSFAEAVLRHYKINTGVRRPVEKAADAVEEVSRWYESVVCASGVWWGHAKRVLCAGARVHRR